MSGGGSSSGGGGGNKKPGTEPAQPGTTVQPFMPGMDQMLAQQLAAGGYGAAPDIMAYLNQFYAPMQLPNNSIYTVPPKPPKTGGGGGGGGGSGSGGGGSSGGGGITREGNHGGRR